jgi:glycosyltransferase involved in cell wall biosynthesis
VFYTPHGFSFIMDPRDRARMAAYRLFERAAGLAGATVIGVSEYERDLALQVAKNALCINNGVDLAGLPEPRPAPGQGGRPRAGALLFGTAGRVVDAKAPALFNEIARRLPGVGFVWIGGGGLENALTAPNIRVTGWLPRPQTLDLINRLDVFLIPSKMEAFPLCLLEAMALKKVCVTSALPVFTEIIRDGENGFVVGAGQGPAAGAADGAGAGGAGIVDAYVGAAREILSGRHDLAAIAEAARRTVVERFTLARSCRQYAGVYRAALEGGLSGLCERSRAESAWRGAADEGHGAGLGAGYDDGYGYGGGYGYGYGSGFGYEGYAGDVDDARSPGGVALPAATLKKVG